MASLTISFNFFFFFFYFLQISLTSIFFLLLPDVDIFVAIVSALIHDFDHPGVNNAFEVSSSSLRAIRHNDLSVLENHHLSSVFEIIKQTPEANIFIGLTLEQ